MTYESIKQCVLFSRENPTLMTEILYRLAHPHEIPDNIALADIPTRLGVSLAAVKATLPTSIPITLGAFTENVTVAWGTTTTPSYNADSENTYALEGIISGLPGYFQNTGAKKFTVNIVIAAWDVATLTSLSLGTTPVLLNTFVEGEEGAYTGAISITSAQAAIGQAYAIVTTDTLATISVTGLATGAVTAKAGVIANGAIDNGAELVITITAEDGSTVAVYTITVTVE